MPVKSGHHGGAGNCLVCHLPEPEQALVEASLASGTPLYRLAKKWGINRASLRAHKDNHMGPALMELRTERIANGVRTVEAQVEEVVARDDAMYDAARAVRNMPLAIKANNSKADHLELLAKLRGELDDRPQITFNYLQHPSYVAVRTIIFEALEPYPEVRREISLKLRALADTASDPGS